MKPKKEQIVEQMTKDYYPELYARRRSAPSGSPLQVLCEYPAVYVMTRTDKRYKAMMVDPTAKETVTDKDGNEVEVPAPAAELHSDHAVVIPTRYTCVQCLDTFNSTSDFDRHIRDAEMRRKSQATTN